MRTNDDPRVSGDYVRHSPGDGDTGDLFLAGVVHDHPASKYRVMDLVRAVDPDVLALELPPIAVPLFERYAEDDRVPPAFGSEMSTAIQAATTDTVVGIDGPTFEFLGLAAENLYREDASVDTVRGLLAGITTASTHAITCRLAAALMAVTGLSVEVTRPTEHDCTWDDDPAVQAADERRQIRRAKAIENAFGVADARHVREETRERHMAGRLSRLREDSSVVAVVGAGHLGSLAEFVG